MILIALIALPFTCIEGVIEVQSLNCLIRHFKALGKLEFTFPEHIDNDDEFADCYEIVLEIYAETEILFRNESLGDGISNIDCVASHLKKNGYADDALLLIIYDNEYSMSDDNHFQRKAELMEIVMQDKLLQSKYFCNQENAFEEDEEEDDSSEFAEDDLDDISVDDGKVRQYCMRKYVYDNNIVEDPEDFVLNPDKLNVAKVDCGGFLFELFVEINSLFDQIFKLIFTEQIVKCVLDLKTKKEIFDYLMSYVVSSDFDSTSFMYDQTMLSDELQGMLTKKFTKCARKVFKGSLDLSNFW